MSGGGAAPYAWELPDSAQVVALVFAGSDAERSATAIDTIATSIARRRGRTLVVNTDPGPSPLDVLACAEQAADSGGVAAVLGRGARLADIAVQRPDCPYMYLPAGPIPEGVAGLLASAAFARFVASVRERNGTLFLVMSEDGDPAPDLLPLLDGYIAVGTVPGETHGSMLCYGRVSLEPDAGAEREPDTGAEREPDAEDAPEPQPEAEAEPVPAPAPARRRRRSGVRVAVALLPAAVLGLGGWWAYGNGWLDAAVSSVGARIAARPEDPPAPATPAEEGAAAEAVDTPADPPESAAPPPVAPVPDEAAVASAFESAPERPFSVLLASFRDPVDAAARLAEIRALHAGVLYFIAPTTIREVEYHRILAGAAATEADASALMDELAAAGVVEEATGWLLRPVSFAYDLGAFTDRPQMEARVAELASRGIHAYGLETALDGLPVFRVYGGAYESAEAALPMGDILQAAGEPATLIVRRGDTMSTP